MIPDIEILKKNSEHSEIPPQRPYVSEPFKKFSRETKADAKK